MTKNQTQALRKGTEIAVYEIKDVLGNNSSEITYRAWNEHLNTTVILKEFFPSDYVERCEEDQFVREKSKKESAVFDFGVNNFIQNNEKMLGIQHPSVQGAHNVLKFNHTAYFAVDDEQGTLLAEQLEKSKSFNEEELRIVLTSLLNALQNTHEADIVHGDIRPDNILIRKNGEPVLLNFAAAHQRFAEHVKMFSFELPEGYASPEQYVKEGDVVGASTDFYSLGATLYRCITKIDPVDAKKRILDLKDNKADPLTPIFEQAEVSFSEDFLRIIDWMLQLDVQERPHSASDILTELNKDNKNLKAIEATTPVKVETKNTDYTDAGSKSGQMGIFPTLVGMVGAVAIGSALIWFLQQGKINQESNITEQVKLVDVTPVVQEPDSGISAEVKVIQSGIEPKQEPLDLVNLPEEVPAYLAEEGEVDSIVESTEPLSPPDQLIEVDSINENSPAIKLSEESIIDSIPVKPKTEPKIELSNENKVLTKDDLIEQHLARAEESLTAFRLTTPDEDNAYFHYKAVLEIAPDHEGALKGLRQVVDRYILLIDKAIQKDEIDFARVYLNRAKNILPNSPYLKSKAEELNSYLALPEN
jgi:tRNA A-37 threonylcarbamoyl transferase component Bud32